MYIFSPTQDQYQYIYIYICICACDILCLFQVSVGLDSFQKLNFEASAWETKNRCCVCMNVVS